MHDVACILLLAVAVASLVLTLLTQLSVHFTVRPKTSAYQCLCRQFRCSSP